MSLALTDTTNSRAAHAQRHTPKRLDMAADHSKDFSIDDRQPRCVRVPRETDRHKLDQRQKQIDFGKNTLGYAAYLRDIPRHQRSPEDPVTPDKSKGCSKRAFDGMIKKWRRELHRWDPSEGEGDAARPLVMQLPPPPPGVPSTDADAAGADARTPPAQGASFGDGSNGTADANGASRSSGLMSASAGSKRRLDDASEAGVGASQAKLMRTSMEGGRSTAAPEYWADNDPADDPLPAAYQEAAAGEEDIFGDWDDDDVQI